MATVMKMKESKYIWISVVLGDGEAYLYEAKDYSVDVTEDMFMYIWKESKKDPFPLAIININTIVMVEFYEEKPNMVYIPKIEEGIDVETQDDI